MNTLKLQYGKFDFEKAMIAMGIAFMEASGMILLICGLFDIRLF